MAKIISLATIKETMENHEKHYCWKKDLSIGDHIFPQPIRCDFDLKKFEQKKGALIWTRKQS